MVKILIIDDNVELQKIYEEVLQDAGYEVVMSLTGQDGLQRAIQEKPSAIILDLMLASGINGFDVLNDLKRHPVTQHIPIVVLTNLDSEEKHALEMGVSHYYIKSNTSFDVLLQKIQQLTQRN